MTNESPPPPKKRLIHYRYYDSPEGCDTWNKVFVTSKYGAVAGVILSTYDVLMYSHAVGWAPILRRYALHTVPLALMGATFATVANGVTNWRQKNDVLNYFIGGFACGPILACYLGSYHAVLLGGIGLGIAGAVKKTMLEHQVAAFPVVPSHMGTVWEWRKDYSLAHDPRDDILSCGIEKKY